MPFTFYYQESYNLIQCSMFVCVCVHIKARHGTCHENEQTSCDENKDDDDVANIMQFHYMCKPIICLFFFKFYLSFECDYDFDAKYIRSHV